MCEDYLNPNFKNQYYLSISKSKDGMCESLKEKCILALILKDFLSKKIENDISVLARKQKTLITHDDYGDLSIERWITELHSYYKNKIEFNLDVWLRDRKNINLFSDNLISAFDRDEIAIENLANLIKTYIEIKMDEYRQSCANVIPYDREIDGY